MKEKHLEKNGFIYKGNITSYLSVKCQCIFIINERMLFLSIFLLNLFPDLCGITVSKFGYG